VISASVFPFFRRACSNLHFFFLGGGSLGGDFVLCYHGLLILLGACTGRCFLQGLAEHKDTLGAPLCPCRSVVEGFFVALWSVFGGNSLFDDLFWELTGFW
jgi:hypothetical protein